MIRFGIIGLGKMGRIRVEALRERSDVNLVCGYDPTYSYDSLPNTRSVDELLQRKDIDAVAICTPNHLNKAITIEALRCGKHVFCEKPPAFNAAEMAEIRKVEEASEKNLMYGFNHRHHRSVVRMKEIIGSGQFGRVLWMRGRYGKSVEPRFFETWRSKKELAGGGILLDQGIHMVDLFLYLCGTFHEAKAYVSNLYWKSDLEDNVFAILRNKDTGVVASLHSTMTQWRHLFSLEVFMERGSLILNGLKTSSGTYGDEKLSISRNRSVSPAATWEDEENITYHTDSSWAAELDHFICTIREGRPVEIGNSKDAAELMRLIDMIYQDGMTSNEP